MSRPPVADQAERDRLVSELERTFFVEAGAGTGKTAAVVSGIVARVAAGRLAMERLVAITFTIAAAGELRVRIREELEAAAAGAAAEEERLRLAQAASEVDRARIETIHAFCSALLRMHPLEAGLPPDFETLADLAGELDVRERFRRWFDALTPGEPGAEAVRRGLLLGLRPDKLLDLFLALSDNWDVVEQAAWPVQAVAAVDPARVLAEDVQRCIDLLPLCRNPDQLHQQIDALRLVATRLGEAADEDAALAALITLEDAPKLGNTGGMPDWDAVDGINACKDIEAPCARSRRRRRASSERPGLPLSAGLRANFATGPRLCGGAPEARPGHLPGPPRPGPQPPPRPPGRPRRAAGTVGLRRRRRVPGHRSPPGGTGHAPLRDGRAGTAGGASWRPSPAGSAWWGTPSSRSTASVAPTSPCTPPSSATWSGLTRGRGFGSRSTSDPGGGSSMR